MSLDFSILKPVRLGADPEFFIIDKKSKEFIPAYETGVIGTKSNPQPLPSGGAVQVDGMALEFNIQPCSTKEEFVSSINTALQEIHDIIPDNFEFSFLSSATFSKEVWDNTPQEYKRLGCEPDFSMTTLSSKMPSGEAGNKPYRTAGGHIHVSWTEGMDPTDPRAIWDCSKLVECYEIYLSEFKKDPDKKRRDLYGEPGSFRPKSYGVEWRSPSCWWLTWTDKQKASLFNLIQSLTIYKIADSWYFNKGNVYTKMGKYYMDYRYSHSDSRVALLEDGLI